MSDRIDLDLSIVPSCLGPGGPIGSVRGGHFGETPARVTASSRPGQGRARHPRPVPGGWASRLLRRTGSGDTVHCRPPGCPSCGPCAWSEDAPLPPFWVTVPQSDPSTAGRSDASGKPVCTAAPGTAVSVPPPAGTPPGSGPQRWPDPTSCHHLADPMALAGTASQGAAVTGTRASSGLCVSRSPALPPADPRRPAAL